MQAVEALQRVIARAKNVGDYFVPGDQEARDAQAVEFGFDDEAIGICTTFLDTAVPLARFRCYVTVEGLTPKSKIGLGDFTISSVTIPGIKNGLLALRMEKVNARILLWELQQEKADMISGYQGDTKTLGFRRWLADIDRHEVERVE